MRIPDLTARDGGIAHCKKIGLKRPAGGSDMVCDLTLVFPISLMSDEDEEEEEIDVDDIELPPMLEYCREMLAAVLDGRTSPTKVQHDCNARGRASLHVLVGESREQVAYNVRADTTRVTLHAERIHPRVVWTVRLSLPQATAGALVGALETRVDVRFEPSQAELPMPPRQAPGGRAEA